MNYDSHFVIAAQSIEINNIKYNLKHHGIIHQQLPINYAFHSSYVENAKEDILTYLRTLDIHSPEINFISSATGMELDQVSYHHFWDVIRKPIHYNQAVMQTIQQPYHYIDVGPGGVLHNILKRLLPTNCNIASHFVMSPMHHDIRKLNELIQLYT